jgi:hypothetical protein
MGVPPVIHGFFGIFLRNQSSSELGDSSIFIWKPLVAGSFPGCFLGQPMCQTSLHAAVVCCMGQFIKAPPRSPGMMVKLASGGHIVGTSQDTCK